MTFCVKFGYIFSHVCSRRAYWWYKPYVIAARFFYNVTCSSSSVDAAFPPMFILVKDWSFRQSKYSSFKLLVAMEQKSWAWHSTRYFFLFLLMLCPSITLDISSFVTTPKFSTSALATDAASLLDILSRDGRWVACDILLALTFDSMTLKVYQ